MPGWKYPRKYGALEEPYEAVPLTATDLATLGQALFLPWLAFIAIFALESFTFRYRYPLTAHFFSILIVVALLLASAECLLRRNSRVTWGLVLLVTSILACVVGFLAADQNYNLNTFPVYETRTMNTYQAVNPSTTSGSQIMDAGRVDFTLDSRVDPSKTMAFVGTETFCAAPITSPSGVPASYDFWAIGLNCCSHNSPFQCGEYASNPTVHQGVRLLRDDFRPYFRLAVQQAEAAYGITATHPVFFDLMQDPDAELQRASSLGQRTFVTWIFISLVFQLVIVGVATWASGKASRPHGPPQGYTI